MSGISDAVTLIVMNHFSLAVFKIFSLSLTLKSLTMLCLGVNLSVLPAWLSLTSLDRNVQVLMLS